MIINIYVKQFYVRKTQICAKNIQKIQIFAQLNETKFTNGRFLLEKPICKDIFRHKFFSKIQKYIMNES